MCCERGFGVSRTRSKMYAAAGADAVQVVWYAMQPLELIVNR